MFRTNNGFSILLVQLAILLVVVAAEDYCNILRCSNPKDHVLCQHPTNTTGEQCGGTYWKLVRAVATQHEKELLIASHVKLMNIDQNNPERALQWDHDLEVLAQRWAMQCPDDNTNDACRSLNIFNSVVQQNVYKESQNYLNSLRDEIAVGRIVTKFSQRSPNLVSNKPQPNGEIYNRIGCGVAIFGRIRSGIIPGAANPGPNPTPVHRYVVCNYAGV